MAAQRLPISGQDGGVWGDILNGFLEVEHNLDGTLKIRTDGTFAPLTGGKVPLVNLGGGTASFSNFLRGDGVWSVPSGIPAGNATVSAPGLVQLAGDLGGSGTSATAPTLAATANVNTIISSNSTVAGKLDTTTADATYAPKVDPAFTGTVVTPNLQVTGGTPSAGDVLTSDSSGNATWTAPAAGAGDATLLAPGIIQLAGDLAGTATVPIVAKLNGVTISGTPAASQVLTASSDTAASWTAPAAGFADPTTTKGDLIIRGTSTTARQPIGTDGQVLTADSTQSTGAKWTTLSAGDASKLSIASNLSDLASAATARTNLGLGTAAVMSATAGGDLSGTLPSPTVAKINGVTLPASAPANGDVLTATSTTATDWITPAAGVSLDTTAGDIAPLGTQNAGVTGKAADAGHVHAMPTLNEINAPTASVALGAQKITGLANGTAPTDAAAYGQIPVAGTGPGTFAAGNDSRIANAPSKAFAIAMAVAL